MSHSEYTEHVRVNVASRTHESEFRKSVEKPQKAADILLNLDFDPAKPILEPLYSGTNRGKRKDPLCMLRSLILMALSRYSG
ncbi:MAG: hypothetical protein GY850_30320, partial [bacterium]|nr:hypothetical protein [bacterium]